MKKMFICCATLCLALSLFCVSALAGDLEINVSPVDANAVQVAQKAGSADPIFTVSKSGAQSGQLYLVMIQQVAQGTDASAKPLPTKENLYYLNVEEATGASFSTEAYPRDLEEGAYIVYLSDYSGSNAGAATGVGAISVSAGGGSGGGGKRGNVDGVGDVDINDAIYILKYLANIDGYSVQGKEDIANVDGVGGVDINDAIYILKYLANIEGYSLSK